MMNDQLLLKVKEQINFLQGIQKVCHQEIERINELHDKECSKYAKISAELEALDKLRLIYEPKRTN